MTDVDFCTGKGCALKDICERYANYRYRVESGLSVTYARNGKTSEECPQFKQREFYGN